MFHSLIKRHFLRLLGWVLHVANTRPHTLRGKEFYAVKTQLLRRWGELDGTDLQHIYKPCFPCDGTGKYGRWECRKCYGTGAYQEFWTVLQRYKLGGYSFHHPLDRTYKNPDLIITIEGYINHKHLGGHKASEANYWLFFFFAPRVFWRTIGKVGHHRAVRQCLPMCSLSWAIFHLRDWFSPRRWRDRIKWRIQQYHWRREALARLESEDEDSDEIPF